ncbi:hypothetical protein J5N58_11160 [Rhizobium cremeum]|uniref:hypothetical protein n=1 Tax=Rhizobium cremeum TaxID=2813827 RepID=UPI000DDD37D8|nr:hypothetical protein [Rhizobium cremeum]MCJ7994767.1 hypothetical protein [Rhizobium cremeum]MCJ8000237.1 hypothetical protein [Rhizobium cremeum]
MTKRLLIRAALSLASFMPLGVATESLAATPSCEQVAGHVSSRFARNNRDFLKMDLAVQDFGSIREGRFEPADDTHRVERRYCQTTITGTDGQRRKLWYLIESTWGFAGVGPSVEFCASGLDPWHVYGAHCASLR